MRSLPPRRRTHMAQFPQVRLANARPRRCRLTDAPSTPTLPPYQGQDPALRPAVARGQRLIRNLPTRAREGGTRKQQESEPEPGVTEPLLLTVATDCGGEPWGVRVDCAAH